MPDTETRAMTVAEIALMREIVKWRRNHGVDFWRARRIGRFIEWKCFGKNQSVAHDLGDAEISHGSLHGVHDRIDVQTVMQAVDILAALGYLPARFSSSYRAGWDASYIWEHAGTEYDEFRRMFQDPENISTPAGEHR
jgi:hypothetical protein